MSQQNQHYEILNESSRRKFPRLFLTGNWDQAQVIEGLSLEWLDRQTASVVDISESGIVIQSAGFLGQARLGQMAEVRLRFACGDWKVLPVKVLRMTAKVTLLSLDSLSSDGRLRCIQEEREKIVSSSWKKYSTASLHPQFHQADWYHSTFDTNLWVWRNQNQEVEKMIAEFESVTMVSGEKGPRFLKTSAACDEGKGYVGALVQPLPHKVEPGLNWAERLFKLLPENLRQDSGLRSRILQKSIRLESLQIHV